MSMSCFDCHDYMDGYNCGKKECAIEELEKLKIKIEKEREKSLNYPNWEYSKGLCKAIEIIDDLKTELKGENNGTHNDNT